MRPFGGMTLSYEAPSGEMWTLISPDRVPGQLVHLSPEGAEGLSGVVERTESASVSRHGARPDGWRVLPLDITLEYTAKAPLGELESVVRAWRQAWDTELPGDYGDPGPPPRAGRLHVSSPVGGDFWTPVSSPVFPDWPHNLHRHRSLSESMTCRSWLGHWWGSAEHFTGDVVISPVGDRPLSPPLRLLWDGSATSVLFPSGLRVNLPEIGVERIINLDRGMSGQMTRPDGTVDTAGWSALQGMVHGVSLRPGVDSHWVLGDGVVLEVTPRFLSPWG